MLLGHARASRAEFTRFAHAAITHGQVLGVRPRQGFLLSADDAAKPTPRGTNASETALGAARIVHLKVIPALVHVARRPARGCADADARDVTRLRTRVRGGFEDCRHVSQHALIAMILPLERRDAHREIVPRPRAFDVAV